MKRARSVALISKFLAVILLIQCIIPLSGCSDKHTHPLVGEWVYEAQSGDSSVIITFEETDDKLTGVKKVLDVKNGSWVSNTFEVQSIEGFFITLLLDNGTLEKSSFSVSKDTLYLSGNEFKNESKYVPINRFDTYIADGVIKPVIDDVYFGMSESELKSTTFYKEKVTSESNRGDRVLYVTGWGNPLVTCSFYYDLDDNGHLCHIKMVFGSYFHELAKEQSKKLMGNLIKVYNNQHGTCTSDGSLYQWQTGNMIIDLDDQSNGDAWYVFQLEFSLKNAT